MTHSSNHRQKFPSDCKDVPGSLPSANAEIWNSDQAKWERQMQMSLTNLCWSEFAKLCDLSPAVSSGAEKFTNPYLIDKIFTRRLRNIETSRSEKFFVAFVFLCGLDTAVRSLAFDISLWKLNLRSLLLHIWMRIVHKWAPRQALSDGNISNVVHELRRRKRSTQALGHKTRLSYDHWKVQNYSGK